MKKPVCLLLLLLLVSSCGEWVEPSAHGLVPPTVDEDLSLPAIDLTGTRLHVQTFGSPDSTKVFVLEGGPGEDFRYMLSLNTAVEGWKLTDHYQVIYHDYRGCGLSRRHPMEELSFATMLQDLEELIDHYASGEKVILIGHSHGGFVAGQYLNEHPERVKGAVFMEPGAFSTEINDHAPAVIDVNFLGRDLNAALWFRQLIGMNDHEQADYAYAVGTANWENRLRGSNCPNLNYRSGAAAAIAIAIDEVYQTDYDFTTRMGDYSTEVLFVSSGEARDLGYDFQQDYQAILFPQYQHQVVEGTGHAGLLNCKVEQTLGFIRTYLESL